MKLKACRQSAGAFASQTGGFTDHDCGSKPRKPDEQSDLSRTGRLVIWREWGRHRRGWATKGYL